MISPDLLKKMRCPLDKISELTDEESHLTCQRCQLQFPVRDGFPTMLVEEAKLPKDCTSIEQLPCQREKQESTPKGSEAPES